MLCQLLWVRARRDKESVPPLTTGRYGNSELVGGRPGQRNQGPPNIPLDATSGVPPVHLVHTLSGKPRSVDL